MPGGRIITRPEDADVTQIPPGSVVVVTQHGPKGDKGDPGAGLADATATVKGKIQLAGDLAGTADAPTVPGLAGKASTDALAAAQATADAAVPKAGGTMTAPLVLSGDPTLPLHAATRQFTLAQITAAINALVAGAPGALDTLNEIATQLANDESAAAALTTTVAGKATIAALNAEIARAAAAETLVESNAPKLAQNGADYPDAGTVRLNLKVPMLPAARVAATSNIASLSGLPTIDGYTLTDDGTNADRVLLTAQTTASQNGVWLAHTGAWTRPSDFPTAAVFVHGRTILVTAGSTPGATWGLAGTLPVTVGTTAQTWVATATKATVDLVRANAPNALNISSGNGMVWNGTAWVDATLVKDPGSGADGDILVRSGATWARLARGSSSQQMIVRSDGTIGYVTASFHVSAFGGVADAVLAGAVGTDNASAFEACWNAAAAVSGTMVIPAPPVGKYFSLRTKVNWIPVSGPYVTVGIEAQGSVYSVQWDGASGTDTARQAVFNCQGWKFCHVTGLKLRVGAGINYVTAWECDNTITASQTSFAENSWSDVSVTWANARTGIIGWRIGHLDAYASDFSSLSWKNCHVNTVVVGTACMGWVNEGNNSLVLVWSEGSGALFQNVAISNKPTPGAFSTGGGASLFVHGFSCSHNDVDFQFRSPGVYGVYGGRFESGGHLLETGLEGSIGSVTVEMSGLDVDDYSPSDGQLIVVVGSTTVNVSGGTYNRPRGTTVTNAVAAGVAAGTPFVVGSTARMSIGSVVALGLDAAGVPIELRTIATIPSATTVTFVAATTAAHAAGEDVVWLWGGSGLQPLFTNQFVKTTVGATVAAGVAAGTPFQVTAVAGLAIGMTLQVGAGASYDPLVIATIPDSTHVTFTTATAQAHTAGDAITWLAGNAWCGINTNASRQTSTLHVEGASIASSEPFVNMAAGGNNAIGGLDNVQCDYAGLVSGRFRNVLWVGTGTVAGQNSGLDLGNGPWNNNPGAISYLRLGVTTPGGGARWLGGFEGNSARSIVSTNSQPYPLHLLAGTSNLGIVLTADGRTQNTGGRIRHRTLVASYPYTILLTDDYVAVATGVAGRHVLLPSAATAGIGHEVWIKDWTGGGAVNPITIDANGSDLIDGAATKTLSTAYGIVKLICGSSTTWEVV